MGVYIIGDKKARTKTLQVTDNYLIKNYSTIPQLNRLQKYCFKAKGE